MDDMIARLCNHDNGFHFAKVKKDHPSPWGFACNHNCGYSLNFNPEQYPGGPTYDEWKEPTEKYTTQTLEWEGKHGRLSPKD